MQINENFYGGADKTETGGGGTKWTTYFLRDAFNNGTLPLNTELDLSISPWAINKNADVVQICYPLSYRVGDSGYVHADPKFYPIHDDAEKNIPFYFCVPQYSGTYAGAFYWYARNGYYQEEIPENTFTAYRDNVKILRGFDYNKFALYPRVYYADYPYSAGISNTNFGRVSISEINSYFSNADSWIADHPIIGMTFAAYYKGYDGGSYYVPMELLINMLARQIPCEISGTAGNINGYDVPFLDNFMTIAYSGLSIGAYGNNYGGNGRIPIYNGSAWVHSYSEDVDVVLSLDSHSNYIAHVPKNERNTGSKWTVHSLWDGASVYYRTELQLSAFADAAEMKDYVLKQAAYLGTWFFTESAAASETAGASDKWYLGEIDENGVTTGNYKQGAATSDYSNSTWADPWESSPYSGRDDDPTPWDSSQTSGIITETGDPSYGTKEYLMTENALNQLIRVLNEFKIDEASGTITSGYCETAFGDTDPMKAIISVIKYPFDIINNWNGNISEQIIDGSDVGNYFSIANATIPTSIQSTIPVIPTQYTLDLTSTHEIYEINWTDSQWKYGTARIPYYEKYKSFLDYEPYCTASLYVPFCGSVKLDPELFVGHSIGVDYIVSPLDGTVKAFVMRDNLVIDTLTGNMGNSIEIDSSDELAKSNSVQQLNATIQAQKMNNVKRWSNVGVGAIGGAVVGGGVGAVVGGAASVMNAAFDTLSSSAGIEKTRFEIETAETPFKQLQSGGGFLSACDEYAVRLVVYRPETLPGFAFDNWNNYGHLYGFATYETGTLENYAGYVECSAANLDGIAATETEKGLIMDLLKGGVYL